MAVTALPAAGEIVERVVVSVNGEIITQSEFAARQLSAVQAARVAPEGVGAFLRENNAKLLQEAIDDLLVIQRARELGVRLRPEYINQVVEDIRKENGIASDEQLQQQLRAEGMTLADLKRNIERSIMRREVLRQELESRFKVSDADARAEYEQLKASEFHEPASVTLQEIALAGDDARDRAAEVIARVRAGEDFAALARALSTAPTAAAGGELGRVVLDDVSPALRQAVASLPEGGLSEPVPLGDGYRVFRVVSRSPARTRGFEEVKDQLLERLRQQRAATEYQSYVQGLRKNAIIRTHVREVSQDVEAGTGIVPTLLGGDLLPGAAPPAPTPAAAPAPALDTPAPALDTPAPALDTPAPALDTPAPALDTPAPALDAPAPALDTPEAEAPAASPAPAAAEAPATPPAPAEEDELSVSPQEQPRHVVPPAVPTPPPAASPSPTPEPRSQG